jgi:phosphoenolpyruvate phosphomutase
MLQSAQLEFLMEAHNGLSAKIVEEAGFKGIWGSGLSISAALGVRDNNEASWTQVLDVLEFMSDATGIPILLDGDTGYGNFNNMRRLVKKLEQRDIAGVCIEDKLFPKTNSFIAGEAQPLADIDEFCGKIKAARDTQLDPDFVVVARVEAFIAGWGLDEALRRAEAYRLAGADAILVHSKKSNPSDIEAFMKEWSNRHPVIIVPTKYYSTPTDYFRQLGISMVIWANHNVRAAVQVMQQTSKHIFKEQSLTGIEEKVASVAEIFRLQGAEELQKAEKKYLPTAGKQVNSIILAASQGHLGKLTREKPKTLLRVHNKTLLETLVEKFNKVGIKDISVVRGFEKSKICFPNISTIDNDLHTETKELYSLFLVKDKIMDNTVISYGDIIFRSYILNDLLNDPSDITIIVSSDTSVDPNREKDFVRASKPYNKELYSEGVFLREASTTLPQAQIDGEFIGLWKVTGNGAQTVKEVLEKLSGHPDFKQMTTNNLFNEIVKTHPVAVKYIQGSWIDIDTMVDLHQADEMQDI